MARSTLEDLGRTIFSATSSLSTELSKAGISEPTIEQSLPNSVLHDSNSAINALRTKLLQITDELSALLVDPALLLTPELRNPLPGLHSVIRLGIAEAVPPPGATVQQVAEKVGRSESLVRRLLGSCATHRIYAQKHPDFFVHTAASRLLLDNAGMRQWILIGAEEMIPATLKTADALIKFPDSEEPEHCGWSMQNSTDKPVFHALADMPERGVVFANAMKWHSMQQGFSTDHLVHSFPWANELLVVDVGGGQGHVSCALANHNPSVRCIVEDQQDAISQGEKNLATSLKGRVNFRAHDFFAEQPVKNADVYLLRLILHDWSDKYAKRILRALIPALRHGAKVIIQDRVVPGYGEVTLLQEREARDYDMYMLAFQNAKERSINDWIVLLREVDVRFELMDVRQPVQSYLAVVEFSWVDIP